MKSEHEIAGNAAAHASVLAGVALVPGNENVCAQPRANRVSQVARSPYSYCNPKDEQLCNCVQNALAASAHAFVESPPDVEESELASDPPTDPSAVGPPSLPANAPELLEDEHAPISKKTAANIHTARFTQTSSRMVGAPGTSEAGKKKSFWLSSTEKNQLLHTRRFG
jgi:hypothetical protein